MSHINILSLYARNLKLKFLSETFFKYPILKWNILYTSYSINLKNMRPVLREINIGGLFMPLIQSLADSAGHVPIVSGYKSSWN